MEVKKFIKAKNSKRAKVFQRLIGINELTQYLNKKVI